jgi:prepilin-type N-terminal cleavage/methylation domain-containing protein
MISLVKKPKSSRSRRQGFSLIEAILASSILALTAMFAIGAIVYAQQSIFSIDQRQGAVFFAEEGLEASRSIRDGAFNALADGTHGLAASAGIWVFSGAEDTQGIYTRNLTVTALTESVKEVTANVSWQTVDGKNQTVSLKTRLANWRGD